MIDPDPIPFADVPPPGATAPERPTPASAPIVVKRDEAERKSRRIGRGFAILLTIAACTLHGIAVWKGMGGAEGLSNAWPLWRDDHPLYYHSALVTRSFLAQSGTTAGYDPSFMSGYAKSVVFPASSTLPELVVWAFGGQRPELAYKLYVLISTALVPWLVAAACWIWRIRAGGVATAVLLFLAYLWTDFPINYASLGMVPYLLAIPLSLVATGAFGRFLDAGGSGRWLAASLLCAGAFLVHLTSAMIIAPAGAVAYIASWAGLKFTRHLGVWLLPLVVLATNAFWWLPGLWLSETKGASDFVFRHPEGALLRIVRIAIGESPIEVILVTLGLPGLVLLSRRHRGLGAALWGFCAAGFFWGYLASDIRSLDFLQPGRHTYAFYTALTVAVGAGFFPFLEKLRPTKFGPFRLDHWALAAAVLIGVRILVMPLVGSVQLRIGGAETFLMSKPSATLLWVVDGVKRHAKPGDRVLYEESGFDVQGIPDPYQHGRFSGLIPERVGVELIGGPYLHAALQTNFTQFGEGKLFGMVDWDRDFFVKYARLYRPSLMVCWTPRARRFCQSNPDLAKILEDDGTLLIARISGFEGDAVRGSARVAAAPGRLTVREMSPDLDGSVVLRYHSVPSLQAHPAVPVDATYEEGDPVPFIRLRPSPGVSEVELEMIPPVRIPWASGR
ncbi:ArnT family glycosyltransferase [Paludisphaera borealis]|uniref:Glycosyltransferase RgtA/B/C/D-like domain-containing protein n=1 Tax=Paludisphaera borealis TaxID=1387353 RepID=A0A1U7CJM3_9BACT|nr:hypothetical protein [Paludisphaera borealis]APW59134.1 hypothetical protein BSF38_00548 [Paludisphaera borealis]